ncbi:hypothetical protein ES703_106981 [subsurface metagenome]
MSTQKTCFQFEDFYDQVPDPGFYPSSIRSACFRRSANKNRMLQVVYALEGVEPAYQLVANYFVLEGERVSPSGIFLARRRLVQLYRACRIFPKEGEEIDPTQLLNARLQVRVEHEEWEGRPQLHVVAYRPLHEFLDSEEQIPF